MLTKEEFENVVKDEMEFVSYIKTFNDHEDVLPKLPLTYTTFKDYNDYKQFIEKSNHNIQNKDGEKKNE